MDSDHKLTDAEKIVFGKMCGCDNCECCLAYAQSKVLEDMVAQVRRGKQIAESAREELRRQWNKD